MLDERERKAGVRSLAASAPDSPELTDWLRGEAATLERVLRNQYLTEEQLGDPAAVGALPPEDEAALADVGPVLGTTSGLQRWATLKHLWAKRQEGLVLPAADPAAAGEAERMLEAAAPVFVTLASGREIAVTERSVTCLYALSALQGRMAATLEELDDADTLFARLRDRKAKLPRLDLLRRHIYTKLLRRVEEERRALYVRVIALRRDQARHLFTESGAPAGPLDRAPVWWGELTTSDEARIIGALLEAGPVRYHALGPLPERTDGKGKPRKGGAFGVDAVLVAWGLRWRIGGEPLDRRPGQVLTQIRKTAPLLLGDLDG